VLALRVDAINVTYQAIARSHTRVIEVTTYKLFMALLLLRPRTWRHAYRLRSVARGIFGVVWLCDRLGQFPVMG
jgi:hypothetical protein